MLRSMKRVMSWAAALAVASLVGCGADEEKPKPITGPAKQVADRIGALERATATRNFAVICEDLLSAAVRRQAGGGGCPAQLRRTAAGVRNPKIRVRKIDIEGSRATVSVTTRAKGQAAVKDTVVLVREDGAWRISQLSAPK